jgi:DNA polymerase-4
MAILATRYGNPGRRIWLMAQGKDPEKVITNIKPPKTMGHGKNMPPETKDRHIILTYFQHMSEKLAVRLRHNGYKASQFFIALKTQQGWLKARSQIHYATNDGKTIFSVCQQFVATIWQGQGAWQIRIVALNLLSGQQTDLFEDLIPHEQRSKINAAVDEINEKFGEFAIAPSRLINRSEMPNVIAPSWQPEGHRKTI